MPDPRIAKSLDVLRTQVNQLYPGRNKDNDGWIGDPAHQARVSDHNPNSAGVVTALDITNDPAHGLVSRSLAETLRLSRDKRIKYVISNRQIFSSVVQPWVWRDYSGSNPHTEHVHISVLANPTLYDDAGQWALASVPAPSVQQHDIVATVFGGSNDRQFSAYDEHLITDEELGVALPFRFQGARPKVRVTKGGKLAVADIVDIGPWNMDDPYWETGTRPQAETGTDRRGRRTNRAGIDLTPGLAAAIGVDGKGLVDWEFVTGAHDVRWMQEKLGVAADGIVGPLTIAAMIKHLEGEQ